MTLKSRPWQVSCQDFDDSDYAEIDKVFVETSVKDDASLADEGAKICLHWLKRGLLGCTCPSGGSGWEDCDYNDHKELDCSGTFYQAFVDAWLIAMIVIGAAGLHACGGCGCRAAGNTCSQKFTLAA